MSSRPRPGPVRPAVSETRETPSPSTDFVLGLRIGVVVLVFAAAIAAGVALIVSAVT